jgi:threonylcarbamoyladenosine tRNA methylthiotransferase MtaB
VFPYSAREGTPAARMPQVKKDIRKARAARLREAGEKNLARYLHGQVGKEISALMEKPGFGRSEHFAPVAVEGEVGAIVRAKVTHADVKTLYAQKVAA